MLKGRSAEERDRDHLRDAVDHARHLLPTQAPIRAFVHHNTLHAFEDLPFDEAVVRAAELLGTEPYEREEAFGAHLERQRITSSDIAAVVAAAGFSEAPLVPGGPSPRELRALRLHHALERVEGPALTWLLEEVALSDFHPEVDAPARARVLDSARRALGGAVDARRALTELHARLAPHAPALPVVHAGTRPRDRVLASHGVDVDEWVHPLMYRLCGAFLDQGLSYWAMPARDAGLLSAFRALYGKPFGPPDPWLRGLPAALAEAQAAGRDAEQTVIASLDALGVPHARWDEVIEATLLAIRGWAGMIAQLEARPDRAPVKAPPCRLMDFLAVLLTLEAQAVKHVLRSEPIDAAPPRPSAPATDLAVVYEAFLVAQLAGIGPAELDDPKDARAFVHEVAAFDSVSRRRLWHRAYERHHRQHVLDGLLAHDRLGVPAIAAPRAQAVFCIDEREESLRRHLEEVDPTMETVGALGFFGVPMAYQGLTDVKPTALCPMAIRPKHLVVEEPIEEAGARSAAARRRLVGKVQNASSVGSQTFVRGGVLSATLGLAAAVPLVGRVLFPRLAERAAHAVEHLAVGSPPTRLRIERAEGDDARDEHGLLSGFTVFEMTAIVRRVLTTTAIGGRLAPLVVVVGHGSSSLNNPHEAAYDCGATGGGRGGPNARAFCAMANHPGVRAALAADGPAIPEGTWFLAGAHDTATDAVDWFDVDLVPAGHRAELARVQTVFGTARRLDAHERCRRFESAPLSLDVDRALAHVEGRAVDLGQPRPECGHATNAICVIGRRDRTRGLFLDRRAFLVSYDPSGDPDGQVLGPLLAAVGPVGAGINLEYYFSFVDPEGYGCGSKLPHNVTGLVGVMNGHASDLRTGLPWQMVEIHEPVRLLTIVEAEPELLVRILARRPGVARVVHNQWIQLVAWSPSTRKMSVFDGTRFVPHVRDARTIKTVATSVDHYRGERGHLGCARVEAALRTGAP
ncbi:MAG: DUF2309 domain-containing protein [Sandaracinaceae bacterium]|nr:DUF2309 domain-containing protein [Sandaracinaceae bacterium]